MNIGDPLATEKFEAEVKRMYMTGLHGVIWQIFRGLYLLPAPFLYRYCHWGEKRLPAMVLTSIPGSLTPLTIGGVSVVYSYPVLALGCSTG